MDFEGQSDKAFWHGYIDFYEKYFSKSIEGLIVELGVFMGDSMLPLERTCSPNAALFFVYGSNAYKLPIMALVDGA